jgi:Basic region leucine zipper
MNTTIDLDELFNDIYYMDLPGAPPAPPPEERYTTDNAAVATTTTTTNSTGTKRTADEAAGGGGNSTSIQDEENVDEDGGVLTEEQKVERRERNREHAKRSRLRKKFLLESLQEQIHGLEEQLEGLKSALKTELPANRAEEIIKKVCGDKEKYTPLPMPSGFGPVKTLMEPDFRLSTYALYCAVLTILILFVLHTRWLSNCFLQFL